MYALLDNTEYSVEERLEMAKIIITSQQSEIDKLTKKLDDLNNAQSWDDDQHSSYRMGL